MIFTAQLIFCCSVVKCVGRDAMIYITERPSRAYDAGATGYRGLRSLRGLRTPVNYGLEPPALCGEAGVNRDAG